MPSNHTYHAVIFLVVFAPATARPQGVGRQIVNVSFGEGLINPGPALAPGTTGFNYTADSCPLPGTYTITNSLYKCPGTRMGRSIDNTPNSRYGYMMLLNSIQDANPRTVFTDTVTENLCPGVKYRFSARMLNASIPSNCNSGSTRFPSFTLSMETVAGQVLQSVSTGPLMYDYDMVYTPKFHPHQVDLVMPAGIDAIVLKIVNDASANNPCAFWVAIDDIQFTSTGPTSSIKFDGAVGTALVKSICFQDNKTITLKGVVGGSPSNTGLQWEQSIDSGVHWTDIPGANSIDYTNTFSVADTFLFRLGAASLNNIANPNCRSVSNVLKVEVDGIGGNFQVSSNSPVCTGSQLQFHAEGGASYVWSGPNNFYDNISYPNIYSTSLSDSGIYQVDIITLGGCRITDSLDVKILGTQDVHTEPDTAICLGSSVHFRTSRGAEYSWSPATDLSATTIQNPVASPAVTTLYTVKVTDSNGCSDTAQVKITLLNSVALKAGISGTEFLCRPADSAFVYDNSKGDIRYRRWDFGNGITGETPTPAVQYYYPGDNSTAYTIKLLVSDTAGCTDTASRVLKVVDNCYIAVPTAFSPNNDGRNDYLYPINAYKVRSLVFKVYNRKGQLIFESHDRQHKWDGTYRGEPQDSGTYLWTFQYVEDDGKLVSLSGNTVLIR